MYWTSRTVNVLLDTVTESATPINLNQYFIYSYDIQMTRGATVGVLVPGFKEEIGPHPDTFYKGKYNPSGNNKWKLVANMTKTGDPTTIIQVFAEGQGNSLPGGAGLQERAIGKTTLIPLNSGPGDLSTRSANDFIGNDISDSPWMPVVSGSDSLSWYTQNNRAQISMYPKRPYERGNFKTGSAGRTNLAFTDSNCYYVNSSLTSQFVVVPDGFGYGLKWDVVELDSNYLGGGGQGGPFYNGGDFTMYALIKRGTGDTVTTAELGVGSAFPWYYLSFGSATKMAEITEGSDVYEIWYRTAALEMDVGQPMFFARAEANFEVNGSPIGAMDYGLTFDPWGCFPMPPPHRTATTDNKIIMGGYISSFPSAGAPTWTP